MKKVEWKMINEEGVMDEGGLAVVEEEGTLLLPVTKKEVAEEGALPVTE